MTQDNNPTPVVGADLDDIEIDLGVASVEDDELDLNLDFGELDEAAGVDDVLLALSDDEGESPSEDDAAGAADEQAVLEELRDKLINGDGDWYVVHTYSGMENRVKQNLDSRVRTLGMEDFIFETVVPTEDVVEIRNGARKNVTRVSHPGYVLVRMLLTNESWTAVRHTPSVTGFVGQANNPVPLTLDEVERMLAPAALAKAIATTAGPTTRKKKVEVADFKVGDNVRVVQGPFAGVHASITEINVNNQRLKALVEILGRETPVDLTFSQVAKD